MKKIGYYILIVCSCLVLIGLLVGGYLILNEDSPLNINKKLVNYCDGKHQETDSKYFTVEEGVITKYSEDGPKDVVIPCEINGEKIIGIGNYMMNVFTDIDSVILPNSLETIDGGAFANNNLKEVHFGENLVTIDGFATIEYNGAFMNNNITTVTFSDGIETIGSQAFRGNEITELLIPSSVKEIGEGAFTDNQLETDQAFIYASNDNTTLVSYGGKERDNVVIPSNVKTITEFAFTDIGLKNVKLNEGLETIDGAVFYCNYAGAFAHNELDTIDFPSSLKQIGTGAFGENKITNISGNTDIDVVEPNVFGYETEVEEFNKKINSSHLQSSCR